MSNDISVPPPPPGPVSSTPSSDGSDPAIAPVNGVTRVTHDSSADTEPKKPQERCTLEDFTRCSECHLWKLMMSFYDRKGIESWSQGVVPHFITCNAFIGRAYAKVLQGFLRDCAQPGSKLTLDPNEPLYIVELGVGAGKFGFYMLKALAEMKDTLDFPVDKIKYVMTDFTDANVQFWRHHPELKPFFEAGQMDSAIFDAVVDDAVTLSESGAVLGPGTVKNPLVVVANYLFDTLCHDIFQVTPAPPDSPVGTGGTLKEGLVSVGSKRCEEPDPLDPDIIKRLDNRYRYDPIDEHYYDAREGGTDALHLRRILAWYKDYFAGSGGPGATGPQADRTGGSILVPIGALRALRRLTAWSGGRCLVVSGDKGNNNPEQFRGLLDPHIAVHGSFSVMVNYHAIGAYFTSRGGFALHNPQEEASLKVSAFLLAPEGTYDALDPADDAPFLGESLNELDVARAKAFPHMREAFTDWVDTFGPNDFFVMQKSLKEDLPAAPLRTVVSILKLSDWDPDVFFKFRDIVLASAPSCGQKLRNDLCRGVPRVWANYYLLDLDKDIAFEVGRFYYGIREYENALTYYTQSVSGVGEHHVTCHNQGLCHYSMGRLEIALEHFRRALAMSAEYEKARSWIEKVSQELAARQSSKDSAAAAAASAASVSVSVSGVEPLEAAPSSPTEQLSEASSEQNSNTATAATTSTAADADDDSASEATVDLSGGMSSEE